MVALLALRPPAALRAHQQPATCRANLQQAAPRVKRAGIYWDLDNINCRDSEHALVIGARLKRAVQRLAGLPAADLSLTVFGNEHTIARVVERSGCGGASWAAVLDLLGAQLVVAGLERDAADLLMRRDMLMFAEEHGADGAVVCVSNDQGYATALERCSSHGAYTVAVGTYLRQAGFNWSARPSLLPVPQAANCIVAWHPGKSSRKSAAELKLVASWQQRLGTDPPVVSNKHHKGVCLTRWANPDRPHLVAQQQQQQQRRASAPAGRAGDSA